MQLSENVAPQQSLPERLLSETRIVKAVASTPEGEFLFDIRDAAVGWSLARGSWEMLETAFVKHIVGRDDLVIDIGANLGWYSVVAAKTAGAVIAFEPDALNYELLLDNLTRNKLRERVVPMQIALSDLDAELEFELSENNFGDHRVRQASSRGPEFYGEGTRRTVRVRGRPLDSVLEELRVAASPIKLLKIDTQGSEVRILRGARKALERTRWMIAEFWPYGLERAGCSVDEFCSIVEANFETFARLQAPEIVLRPIAQLRDDVREPFDQAPGTPVGFSNYLFSK